MAKKRMFSLGVLETDAFMDMPLSAQALYFHLNLRADDDGFVGNPKRVTQNIGASLDDLKLLVVKRFVLAFEDGVIVIKHWRMHNVIRADRYTETNFVDDMKLLDIKDNGAYTFKDFAEYGNQTATIPQPNRNQTAPQIRLGIGSDKGIDNRESGRFAPPTPKDVADYAMTKGLKIDSQKFCDFYASKGWMVGKNKMKDWKAAVRNWCSRDNTTAQPQTQRNPRIQAAHGFSSERTNVNYNDLVMQKWREEQAEDGDDYGC